MSDNLPDDAIAELVDEQLSRRNHTPSPERCPKCDHPWHGLPQPGCPGPWNATPGPAGDQGVTITPQTTPFPYIALPATGFRRWINALTGWTR